MRLIAWSDAALKATAVTLLALAVASLGSSLGGGDGIGARSLRRYTSFLDRTLQRLFMPPYAARILLGQSLGAGAVVTLALVCGLPFWYLALGVIGVAPALHLMRLRVQRTRKIEEQTDGFIVALANALKTVPSPTAALEAIASSLPNPIRQEIARAISEVRVGSTLPQSLMSMSNRVESRTVDTALSAVLVGLQVGGNLPAVLETTAATLREMNRLEGVVRSKTAEGKAQLWVLAVFPFAVCCAFSMAQPGYFDPLRNSVLGYAAILLSTLLWVSALILARKVLTVDI